MKKALKWYILKDRATGCIVAEHQMPTLMTARKFFFNNGLLPEFWSTDFIIEECKAENERDR